MIQLKEIKEALLHLFFPHVCASCGNDTLNKESQLCIVCLSALPETNFHPHKNNPVEKIFWGRLQLSNATAHYYFTKESAMQRLMQEFKYNGNKELGLQLGRLMGESLRQSNRFDSIDALIAIPLFPSKERKRGFNQAEILCEGIAEKMKIPILKNCIARMQHTQTQTKKGRTERWKNMEGKFTLLHELAIENKHLLLVDDVVTTGATLEACGSELLCGNNTKLSIATLCYALH